MSFEVLGRDDGGERAFALRVQVGPHQEGVQVL